MSPPPTQQQRAQARARAAAEAAPPRLWAVDPATYATGVAVFENGLLVRAWTIRLKPRRAKGYDPTTAMGTVLRATLQGEPYVTEHPQAYPGQTAKAKAVAMMQAVLGHLHPAVARYHPAEWKGNIPKDIHHRRIRASGVIDPKRVDGDDNAWDAVALGLFHLGMVGRGGMV